jgi:type I restriction enzyme S subunit
MNTRRAAGLQRYRPYPAYKDSGVEWLGEIPAHWEALKLKRVCTFAYGDSLASEARLDGDFEVYGSNGPVGTHERANTVAPCLVIGRKGSFGKVNFSSSPVFAIDTTFFVDRRLTRADIRWLYYVLTNAQLDSATKDSAIPGLDREDAYARELCLCQSTEQRAIAAFLDRETARIDALVAKKERLIELLREKRTALITRAVTKGLDPNVRMKDAGLEWLGKIPAHWELKALKRIGSLQAGAGFPDDEQRVTTEDIPFFKVGDMRSTGNEREMLEWQHTVSEATARRLRAFVFPPGTIVFAKVGAALMLNRRRFLTRPSCMDNNMMGFMPGDCDPTWAMYWLSGLDMGELANPGAVPSVNEGQMRDTPAIVPPRPEQRAIAAFLERETARIDVLVAKVRNAIERLKELRTALISAAVTGKIDVREEAA